MKRQRVTWLLGAVACAAMAQAAHAQTNVAEAVAQSQTLLVGRIFSELGSGSPQRQLFNLWMADLLLTTGQGPLGAIGIEEAVASGALGVLQQLERSDNGEIAKLARTLRSRIIDELDINDATAATATSLNLADSASVSLKQGEYDGWLAVRTQAGLEYQVEARGCPVLRAVAVGADRQRSLGGTSFGSRLVFASKSDETAYLRVRTPLCEAGGTIAVSSGVPARALVAASTRTTPQPVTPGNRYRGSLREDVEQWLTFAPQAGQRYALYTIPENDALDTVITVYESDGVTELYSDDDGGVDLGSKLEFTRANDATLLIKLHALGGSGDYELAVSTRPSPFASAKAVSLGSINEGSLTEATLEQWWSLDAQPGETYTFEAIPDAEMDTVITVFGADETQLDSDDDGGIGLGSRLEFTNTESNRLLIRVHGVDDAIGGYTLDVRAKAPTLPLAAASTAATAQRVTAGNSYQGSLSTDTEQWVELDAQAGQVYVFETIPDDDLDTVITMYDTDGITELDSDDDSGPGLGSRLELANDRNRILKIKVDQLGRDTGEYQLAVSARPPVLETAQAVNVGTTYSGSLRATAEQWWKLNAEAGMVYVFEASPAGGLDTVVTVYEANGVTELASDDDGGTGVGSRLEFANTMKRTLLIKVHGLDRSAGDYEFVVSVQAP